MTVTSDVDKENKRVIRCKYNSAVAVASSVNGSHPIDKWERWSKAENTRTRVQIPHVIHVYNNNKGGTDLMNHNVNAYCAGIKGKKWWWNIFTWLLHVFIQNAWLLFRKQGSSITQRNF